MAPGRTTTRATGAPPGSNRRPATTVATLVVALLLLGPAVALTIDVGSQPAEGSNMGAGFAMLGVMGLVGAAAVAAFALWRPRSTWCQLAGVLAAVGVIGSVLCLALPGVGYLV